MKILAFVDLHSSLKALKEIKNKVGSLIEKEVKVHIPQAHTEQQELSHL